MPILTAELDHVEKLEKLKQLMTRNYLKINFYSNRDIFATKFSELPGSDLVHRDIKLTCDKPFRQRQFRMAPHLESELQKQVDELVSCGILRESDSPWNANSLMVKKHDGTFRLVKDFRQLNKVTVPQFHYLPTLQDSLQAIGEERPCLFSILDQKSGFMSLKLHENSMKYAAFSTKVGHYEYTRLAQGLTNSPATYCAVLSRLLRSELSSTAILYIDDLCLFTRSFEAQVKLLTTVFTQISWSKLEN